MKFLTALIFVLITIASCKPGVQVCGGVSSTTAILVDSVRLVQTDSLHYEGLPAFHKSKSQICATTIMRDSIIINGKDTITIINMPPVSK
jgi:hypothetical protein